MNASINKKRAAVMLQHESKGQIRMVLLFRSSKGEGVWRIRPSVYAILLP